MKPQIVAIIVSILTMILGAQAYMLYRLNEQLSQLSTQTQLADNTQLPQPNLPKPVLPKPLPDDDFFKGHPWNPYEEMQHMQDEMEQIFGDSFSRFHLNSPLGSLSKSPDIDLQDKPDHYLVTVNAPGAEESSINVILEGQLLHIAIKTQQDKAEDNNKNDYQYRERFVGEFQRVLTLPGPADSSKMKTEYRNGVLIITIPKK